mmetsp:Transcript_28033/g.72481  ORF Transcript_28033/g.72481 Transcript_28033/m.72481 type:complete len:84 (-) Transcript_28033:60-311(-)
MSTGRLAEAESDLRGEVQELRSQLNATTRAVEFSRNTVANAPVKVEWTTAGAKIEWTAAGRYVVADTKELLTEIDDLDTPQCF